MFTKYKKTDRFIYFLPSSLFVFNWKHFIQVNLKWEDLWTDACMLKIHTFKYIEVCSFLVCIFGLASHVCDKILTFSKPALNFEVNKVDVRMYLCHSVTWFGDLHDANKNMRARNGPAKLRARSTSSNFRPLARLREINSHELKWLEDKALRLNTNTDGLQKTLLEPNLSLEKIRVRLGLVLVVIHRY